MSVISVRQPARSHEPASRLARLCPHPWVVALALALLAFVPLIPGGDPTGGGASSIRGVIELGCLFAALALGCWAIQWRAVVQFIWNSRMTGLLLCYTAWSLITAAWSPGPILTIGKAIELGLITIVAVVICVQARASDGNDDPDERVPAALAKTMVFVLAGLLVFNTLTKGTPLAISGVPDVGPRAVTMEDVRPRLVFAYLHPLRGADLLALLVLCALAVPWAAEVKIGIVLAGIAGVVMADARTAVASLAIGIPLVTLGGIRDRRIRQGAIVGVMLTMAAAAILIAPHAFDLGGNRAQELQSLNGRLDLWKEVVELIGANWLGGVGYHATRYPLLEIFPWAGETHNSALEALLGTGVVGGLLALWMVLYGTLLVWRSGDRLLLAAAVYCFAVGMMDGVLLLPTLPMLVLTVLVLNAEGKSHWGEGYASPGRT